MEIYFNVYAYSGTRCLKENEIPSHSVPPRKKKSGWLQEVWGKGKKVHSRTGHEGPDREQRYSSSLSLILALDWGGWSMPHPCWFTPQEMDLIPIVRSLRVDMKHKPQERIWTISLCSYNENSKHNSVMVKLLSLSFPNKLLILLMLPR